MKNLKQPIARRANLEDDRTGHFFEQRLYSGALLTEEALIAAMAYVDLNPVRAELAERIEAIRDTSIADRLQVNSAEALAAYLRPVLSSLDGRLRNPMRRQTYSQWPDRPPRRRRRPSRRKPRPDTSRTAASRSRIRNIPAPRRPKRPIRLPPGRPQSASLAPADRRERRSKLPRPGITLAQYVKLARAMAEAQNARSGNTPDRVRRWLARTKALRKRQRAYGSESALRQWIADRTLQPRETPSPTRRIDRKSAPVPPLTAQARVACPVRAGMANPSDVASGRFPTRRRKGIACVRIPYLFGGPA